MLQNCPPLYLQWDVYKCIPQPESFPISHSRLVPHSLPFWFYNWVTRYLWRCIFILKLRKKVARNRGICQEVGLLVLTPRVPGKQWELFTALLSPSQQSLTPLLWQVLALTWPEKPAECQDWAGKPVWWKETPGLLRRPQVVLWASFCSVWLLSAVEWSTLKGLTPKTPVPFSFDTAVLLTCKFLAFFFFFLSWG